MQYGSGIWYTQRMTPYLYLHTETSCQAYDAYRNISDSAFGQYITETLFDGSTADFCNEVKQGS